MSPCRALLFAREGDHPARPFTFTDAGLVTRTLSTVLCVVIDELVRLRPVVVHDKFHRMI